MQALSTKDIKIFEDNADAVNPLLTDLYQVKMAYAEWKANRHEAPAVFEAFFRKAPFKRQYTVFGGLDEVLLLLSTYKFTHEHMAYLRGCLDHCEAGFFDWLESLSTAQVQVTAVQEGKLVFASEPLLTLQGPLALLQLLETPILNLLNFSSLIATNATRMVMASEPRAQCVEFGLRRA